MVVISIEALERDNWNGAGRPLLVVDEYWEVTCMLLVESFSLLAADGRRLCPKGLAADLDGHIGMAIRL